MFDERDETKKEFEVEGMTLFDIAAMVFGKSEDCEAEKNPFLENLVLETKKRRKSATTTAVFDEEGCQIDLQAQEISTVHYVDKEGFVKVMNSAMAAAMGLSKSGQKMFWFLMIELSNNVGKDAIYLHYALADTKRGRAGGISKNIFYRGLQDLENAGFIKQKTTIKNFYWINPTMIFNGDRIKLVTTYILKNQQQLDENSPVITRPGLKTLGAKNKKGVLQR